MSHSEENQTQTAPCNAQIFGDGALQAGEQFERDFNPATLVELLRHRALHQAERRAFAFLEDEEEERSFSYAELDQRARSIAVALQELNATGERVLLLYPPGLEYVASFFGCLYAGAIAVPIYPPRPNRGLERLREIVADSQAGFALTTTNILSRLRGSLGEEPALEAMRWLDTESLSPDLAQRWQSPELQANTLAFLQYTSGSTSQPKGVMVSHGNLLNNARMLRQAFELTEDSIHVCWLPLYHDMGLIGSVVVPVYAIVPSILMSPLSFLQKPFRWLQAISRYRATVSGGPDFAYNLCVRKVTAEQRAGLDLSSWRLASNGAEPVRAETMKKFAETFRECGFRPEAFYPCYGLAEATLFAAGGAKADPPALQTVDAGSFERGRISVTPLENATTRVLVSCGKAWLDERIVIANPETLAECPPDQVGEIWLSGPNITQGYWNRAEETRQTFHAFLSNTGEGPFLRTGDLGFFRDGELFVAGRIKDLIIIEGRNHYPQDIEQTVERSHPAIRPGGCAVFSTEVDYQERLIIVVEMERLPRSVRPNSASNAGNAATQKDGPNESKVIIQSVRRAVAENHDLQTHAIQLVKAGSIPRTSSGKLRRAACRKAFLAGDLHAWGND